MAIYCSNCGISLPDGVAFCDACGTPVRGQPQQASSASPAPYPSAPQPQGAPSYSGAGAVTCPACGAPALPGEAFCDNCGAALLAGSTYAAAPYTPPSASSVSQPIMPPPDYSQAPMSDYSPSQRMASLVVISPPPPATLSIPSLPEMIVGRSDPQSNSYPDVDLGPYGGLDLGISRRHFRLTRANDQFYVEDLGSLNGTVVNGQALPPHTLHPLRSGDRIALGKMELAFELS